MVQLWPPLPPLCLNPRTPLTRCSRRRRGQASPQRGPWTPAETATPTRRAPARRTAACRQTPARTRKTRMTRPRPRSGSSSSRRRGPAPGQRARSARRAPAAGLTAAPRPLEWHCGPIRRGNDHGAAPRSKQTPRSKELPRVPWGKPSAAVEGCPRGGGRRRNRRQRSKSRRGDTVTATPCPPQVSASALRWDGAVTVAAGSAAATAPPGGLTRVTTRGAMLTVATPRLSYC